MTTMHPDPYADRCCWARGENNTLLREYHDNEWGKPVHDDRVLFEFLVLESFQAGISWWIILKKREAFRKAFDGFDYEKIAQYGEEKVASLLTDEGIVRSKGKIAATIGNAQVFMRIREEFGSFDAYLWQFVGGVPVKNQDDNIPTHTALSDQIAKDLKKRGMKYMGTVITYSFLGAVGVVNDHERCCKFY